MTKRRLETIILTWQKRLGLERWFLVIDWESLPVDERTAEIWHSEDYDLARIWFSPEWRDWDVDEATLNVIHELLHLLLRDTGFVLKLIQAELDESTFEVIRATHEHFLEQAVERLANRILEIAT